MDIVDRLAEARIEEAIERGELDDLPGAGRPLVLDDDSMIPPELRAAYRLLKNSGHIPPELQLRKDIRAAEQLLLHASDGAEQGRAMAKLQLLRTRLEAAGGGRAGLGVEDYYYRKLIAQLSADGKT